MKKNYENGQGRKVIKKCWTILHLHDNQSKRESNKLYVYQMFHAEL